MIPSDLNSRLRLLIDSKLLAVDKPLPAVTEATPAEPVESPLQQGSRFNAQIQQTLPDGNYKAQIAGKPVILSLNESAKAGDTLELIATKVTDKTVYAQQAPVVNHTTSSQVSQTGQMINRLLTGQPPAQPASLSAGKPIVSSATLPPPEKLAPMLQQAISESGLFYEAHQAEWVQGSRDLHSLLREPQGQLSQPSAFHEAELQQNLAKTMGAASPSTQQSTVTTPPGNMLGGAQAATPLTSMLPTGMNPLNSNATILSETPQAGAAVLADATSEPTIPATPPNPTAPRVDSQALSTTTNSPLSQLLGQTQTPPSPSPSASPSANPAITAALTSQTALPTSSPIASPTTSAPPQASPQPPINQPAMPSNVPAPLAAQRLEQALKQVNAFPVSADSNTPPSHAADPATTRAGVMANSTPSQNAPPSLLPEKLMPVLQQQLEGLSTHQLTWQGQVWPGQMMEWQIDTPDDPKKTDENGHHSQEYSTEDNWTTRLKLTLPSLGAVEAQVHLTPTGLALRLIADQADTREQLREELPALDNSLSAAGITLNATSIEPRREH